MTCRCHISRDVPLGDGSRTLAETILQKVSPMEEDRVGRPIPDAMKHIADAGKKVSALIDDLRNLGLDFSTEVFGQQLTVHVSLGTEKRI